ncbi:hypothetical protein MAPG_05924 [Magnaporthiopsis poae ATCC 64411]|uniref:Ribosomal protein YMR-31 n=1 Tax=Magnaporthiopsis poae (strain ATCC 64411 / 73-15) TaxID=644358 RepID=A0A0C4E0P3_MAGP6|nr:hypothetical protein MAPG_05924 [Magnaporthiopsis poae ATCC 64411]
MFATKVLRQAAAHAERQPLIKFIGKRTIPASIDHTPQPHPASPNNQTPASFASSSFSKYREHAQQFGPLRKTIRTVEEAGVGGLSGSELGPVRPNQAGVFFDRSELPARFRRQPLTAAEIEAIETGGAAMFA